MFTKTDLAKFDNVWDDNPTLVNWGAQKNFAHYAKRIGQAWEENQDQFNEFYFKRAVARAIIFRKTEKMVSSQPWYNGGYRANVVAYTIALLGKVSSKHDMAFDFIRVWNRQDISSATIDAIEIISEIVYNHITHPTGNISNITEWCKRDSCWFDLQNKIDKVVALLPQQFFEELITKEELRDEARSAAKTQKMLSGIEAQKLVLDITPDKWAEILNLGQQKRLYSPKQIEILKLATQIPLKIPSEKQCYILLEVLEKAKHEAIYHD